MLQFGVLYAILLPQLGFYVNEQGEKRSCLFKMELFGGSSLFTAELLQSNLPADFRSDVFQTAIVSFQKTSPHN